MPSTILVIYFPDAIKGALIDAVLNVFWRKQEMMTLVYALLAFTCAVSLELKALGVPETR